MKIIQDAKKILSNNLNGYFNYQKYVENGYHDHKFGANKFDYLAQIPVFGLLYTAIFFSLLYIVITPIHVFIKLEKMLKK